LNRIQKKITTNGDFLLFYWVVFLHEVVFAFYGKPKELIFAFDVKLFDDVFAVGIHSIFSNTEDIGYFL
jgi:hypothetical protein